MDNLFVTIKCVFVKQRQEAGFLEKIVFSYYSFRCDLIHNTYLCICSHFVSLHKFDFNVEHTIFRVQIDQSFKFNVCRERDKLAIQNVNNGRGSAINRVLDGSTYPG